MCLILLYLEATLPPLVPLCLDILVELLSRRRSAYLQGFWGDFGSIAISVVCPSAAAFSSLSTSSFPFIPECPVVHLIDGVYFEPVAFFSFNAVSSISAAKPSLRIPYFCNLVV